MCEFGSRILSDAGYQVTIAANGAAAIAAATQQGAPDLLLTDFKMPQMDGDELAARLSQSWPNLKVLYLTGYSQALFGNRALLWEGETVLEKPCSPQNCSAAVSMFLINRTSATVAELPQAAAVRSLLTGLAKNPSRDVV
jgi:CheY-like chemotaxis protein